MKKAFIQTFGCQMNEHDSQWMMELLSKENYSITAEPKEADLIIINTCSVRENPENKVYSLIGRLSKLKKNKPDLIIGVGGCVAQQEGESLLKRQKAVDLVFGTDNFFNLPKMLKEVNEGKRVVYTNWGQREKKVQNFIPLEEISAGKVEGCQAMIAITKGCDNFCSFCIVPATRGRLVSRDLSNIIDEAKGLITKGAREINLLGQNVNSYQAGTIDFYELLKSVADLKGLLRLRFMSPHPNDWNNKLSDLMASNDVICNQIHLPFQAGSDRILKLMRRGHSISEYLDKIGYLKDKIPTVGLSTDIIVGFPGETDEEFEMTLDVLKKVKFHKVYAFKYSARPGTKAEILEDDVAEGIKKIRLEKLLNLQDSIHNDLLEKFINTHQTVLIENAHPKLRGFMNGRTSEYVPVTINRASLEIGDYINVKITGRKANSLEGEFIDVVN